MRAYILCTTPRSGSTLLCKLLAATGVAGRPESYFHKPDLAAWMRAHGQEGTAFPSRAACLRAVFDTAMEKGRAGTAMFGLRLQGGSLPYFAEQLAVLHPGLDRTRDQIDAAFGPTRYLYLRREDTLDQAISRVMAQQTGLWHKAADGTEMERTAPPAEPCFDRAAIDAAMQEAEALNSFWQDWFTAQNVTPFPINYDALAQDPAKILAEILSFLDLDPKAAQGITTPTAKLADATSADWKVRYLAGDGQP